MEAFKRRVTRWSGRLRAQPREIVVMQMSRKWASCSTRGRVCFARDLLDRPTCEQDYVIVHELLHLRHPNHGRVFGALVQANLPGWRKVAARLPVRPRRTTTKTASAEERTP
jgi:predicted metal-dependent hydrolase